MFNRSRFEIQPTLYWWDSFKDVWDKMVSCNLLETVFYDGKLNCAAELEELLTSDECRTYFCYYDAELIGLVWLTHFDYCTARIHFALFPEGKYRMISVGWVLLDILLRKFRCLIAYLPRWNGKAIKFIKYLGFKYAGKIPDIAYSQETNSFDEMLIFYIQGDL